MVGFRLSPDLQFHLLAFEGYATGIPECDAVFRYWFCSLGSLTGH